ncbi:hypothetical protein DPMN_069356 [Dreissena polymorpha]|uniref:Uncharacterized protein n=1 Tax=Dreissena polymorpha TaxID=45954 RepID=A0A9D4BN04_DREPO|nr:hypothetical protein DPMN_069356 [Dreissena polymorpha]
MAKSYSDAVQNAINRKKASNKYCARKKLILCEPDIDEVHMEVEVGLPPTQSQSDYEFVVRGLETNDASVSCLLLNEWNCRSYAHVPQHPVRKKIR